MNYVDNNIDLQELQFEDQSYDVDCNSILIGEHVSNNDKEYLKFVEIWKLMDLLFLKYPLLANKNVEFSKVNRNETFNVWPPGYDCLYRYSRHFSKVEKNIIFYYRKNTKYFFYKYRNGLKSNVFLDFLCRAENMFSFVSDFYV